MNASDIFKSIQEEITYRRDNPFKKGAATALGMGLGLNVAVMGGKSAYRSLTGMNDQKIRTVEALKPKTETEKRATNTLQQQKKQVINPEYEPYNPIYSLPASKFHGKISETQKKQLAEDLVEDVIKGKKFSSTIVFGSKIMKNPPRVETDEPEKAMDQFGEIFEQLGEFTEKNYDEIAENLKTPFQDAKKQVRQMLGLQRAKTLAINFLDSMVEPIAKQVLLANAGVNVDTLAIHRQDIEKANSFYDIWTISKEMVKKAIALQKNTKTKEIGNLYLNMSRYQKQLLELAGRPDLVKNLKQVDKAFVGLKKLEEAWKTGNVKHGNALDRIIKIWAASPKAEAFKDMVDVLGVDIIDENGTLRNDLTAEQKAIRIYQDMVINHILKTVPISDIAQIGNALRSISAQHGINDPRVKAVQMLMKNIADIKTYKEEEYIQDVDFYNSGVTKISNMLNEFTFGLFPKRSQFYGLKEKSEEILDMDAHLDNLVLAHKMPMKERSIEGALIELTSNPQIKDFYKIEEEQIIKEIGYSNDDRSQQRIGFEHPRYFFYSKYAKELINSIISRDDLSTDELFAINKAKSEGLFTLYFKKCKDLDDTVVKAYMMGFKLKMAKIPTAVEEFLASENPTPIDSQLQEFISFINVSPIVSAHKIMKAVESTYPVEIKPEVLDKKYNEIIRLFRLNQVGKGKHDVELIINALESHRKYIQNKLEKEQFLFNWVDIYHQTEPEPYSLKILKHKPLLNQYMKSFKDWYMARNKRQFSVQKHNLNEYTPKQINAAAREILPEIRRFDYVINGIDEPQSELERKIIDKFKQELKTWSEGE